MPIGKAAVGFKLRLGGRFNGPTGTLALTTVGTTLVRAISSLVLTRLLSPSVYGLVGIITSIFFVIVMLTDLGFEPFVVRHSKSDDALFRNVIWTIHASRGTLLAILGIVSAPLIAWLLQKPALAMPMAVASLTMGINGFASFALFVALKKGGATKLSILDFVLGVVQTVVCIGLAVWLRNVWAIVIAMLCQSVLRTVLSYVIFADSSHRFARNQAIYREFLAFSRIVLASSSLALLISQSDKLFLARMLTLQQYGLYAVALNVVSVPVSFVSTYISRIVYPVYTSVWNANPAAIAEIYYKTRQRASILFALCSGGLIGCAPLLLAILYDVRYRPAALYVSLLAISVALRLQTFAAAEVMTAIGQVRVTLRANVVRVVWLATAGPLGFHFLGATGVICAVGLLEVPALLFSWAVLRSANILDMRYELQYLGMILLGSGAGYGIARFGLHFIG